MAQAATRTALVTGANRGIGFEICRQLGRRGLRVVLTGRDAAGVARAAARLVGLGLAVRPEVLDVSSERSVWLCAARLERAEERVDVLVNNAAIYPPGSLVGTSPEVLRETLAINFLGAVWTCQAFVPGMLRRRYGRVVNVSSGSGSMAEGLEGPAAYCLSKAALNAFTVKLASEVRGDVKVNAVCPGWVRTRMGGRRAPVSVERGAETAVWLATLPVDGPSGGFFRNRRPIAW